MSEGKPWRDEEALRELYIEQDMSAHAISDEFGCSKETVKTWILKFDITRFVCPTCDRDDFISEFGVQVHHAEAHGEKLGEVDKECEVCGEIFSVLKYRDDTARFCSNSCYGVWRSEVQVGEGHPNYNSVDTECAECGTKLTLLKSRYERYDRNFCSKDCMGAAYSEVDVTEGENRNYAGDCALCDTPVERPPSRQYEWTNRVFCGKDCADQWQREHGPRGDEHWNFRGGNDYGPGWHDSKKEAVRERDGRKCVECGRSEEEHLELFGRKHTVHHIMKARWFDDDDPRANEMDNLATLCRGNCHQKWEQMSPLRPQPAD